MCFQLIVQVNNLDDFFNQQAANVKDLYVLLCLKFGVAGQTYGILLLPLSTTLVSIPNIDLI